MRKGSGPIEVFAFISIETENYHNLSASISFKIYLRQPPLESDVNNIKIQYRKEIKRLFLVIQYPMVEPIEKGS